MKTVAFFACIAIVNALVMIAVSGDAVAQVLAAFMWGMLVMGVSVVVSMILTVGK